MGIIRGKGRIFSLLTLEIKAAWKYYAVFFMIMSAIFSATLTVFSSAVGVPSQYADGLRELFPNGAYLLVEVDGGVDGIKVSGADYIYVTNTAATNLVGMRNRESGDTVQNLRGEAHIFKDEVNKNSAFGRMENPVVKGRLWNGSDNSSEKHIWLSASVASELNVSTDDFLIPTVNDLYIPYLELKIIGIFQDDDDGARPTPSFVVSYDLALYIGSMLGESVSGTAILDIYDVMDLGAVTRNLDKADISYISLGNVIDDVQAVNLSAVLFWIVTGFLFFVGGLMLFNLMSVVFKMREKAYARLKILGIMMKEIANICFLVFLSALTAAFLIGILVSLALNNYFEGIANGLFGVVFDIRLIWYAPFVIFFANLLTFYLCYSGLAKKFIGVSPLVIIAEEK
jgi:hypothetical protein